MRKADEAAVWRAVKSAQPDVVIPHVSFSDVNLDPKTSCLVIGGRNGSGKSRFLREVASNLGDKSRLINLHYLCEQALTVLRSREDFDEMKEEYEVIGPDKDRREDIQHVIGRDYCQVNWYAFELDLADEGSSQQFKWGGEQPLLPYFEVSYRKYTYSSRDMGLGEFSVHLLFWILEQYREEDDLTLLLDEPDAFLPPVGSSALLLRLLKICQKRKWRLIVSTHSSEMISAAVDNGVFVLLESGPEGGTSATTCQEDEGVADRLLPPPPVRYVFFVEDESALKLMEVLLEKCDR